VKEIDLNPIFAYKEGAAIVDARIVLESAKTQEIKMNRNE
jgi:hypothetical protein